MGKFIPNGDLPFQSMAELLARKVGEDPARFAVSEGDAVELTQAVAEYRDALQKARYGAASRAATGRKAEARQRAETIVRRVGHLVRICTTVPDHEKESIGVRSGRAKPKSTTVPNEAPLLRFSKAIHNASRTPEHELTFTAMDFKSRPPGAVRLELFVDLVPVDQPVPKHPAHTQGRRPFYLRSFTRSPIRLVPPMATTPMRVVYWGRWADAAGNVGPFSATAVGWTEGGSHHLLGPALGGGKRPMWVDVPDDEQATPELETTVVVALLEASRSFVVESGEARRALPDAGRTEMRQLEGPTIAAA